MQVYSSGATSLGLLRFWGSFKSLKRMIKVVDFSKDLIADWEYDGAEIGIYPGGAKEVRDAIINCSLKGPAKIGIDSEGKVIGAAGMFPWNYWGVAYSWAYINKGNARNALSLVREVAKYERTMAAIIGARRLQTEVLATSDLEIKWTELNGYQREGLMREAGPNREDIYIYAKLLG